MNKNNYIIRELVEDINLKRFVNSYCLLHNNKTGNTIPKLFPMVNAHILLNLGDEYLFSTNGNKITGKNIQIMHPSIHICDLFYGENTCLFGIELSLQGYYYLTGKSPFDKINTIETLSESMPDLEEFLRLISKDLVEKNFSKLNNYFIEKLNKFYNDKDSKLIYSISNKILKEEKINQVLNKYELSIRTLERKFKRNTGLTLKKYQLILRLNELLEDIYMKKNIDWSDLAIKHGFFDQAHMVKVLKKYLHESPSKYLEIRNLVGDLFVILENEKV